MCGAPDKLISLRMCDTHPSCGKSIIKLNKEDEEYEVGYPKVIMGTSCTYKIDTDYLRYIPEDTVYNYEISVKNGKSFHFEIGVYRYDA